jgi:flagellar biosynthesis protein FliQ
VGILPALNNWVSFIEDFLLSGMLVGLVISFFLAASGLAMLRLRNVNPTYSTTI